MRINSETDSHIIAAIKFYKTIQIFRISLITRIIEIKKLGSIIFANMHHLFSVLLYKIKKRYSKENSIIDKRKRLKSDILKVVKKKSCQVLF